MKRILLALILAVPFCSVVSAHPYSPPTLDWLPRSDAVYLVTVDSIKVLNDGFKTETVKFLTTEVLSGKSQDSLTLTAVEGFTFTPHAKYILIHNPGGFKDCVGWTIEGDPEWWPIAVTGDGDVATAKPLGSLSEIRQYLSDHPKKP
jgi:hypothetical protein